MTDAELKKTIETTQQTTQPVKEETAPAPQEQSFDPLNPFLTILNLLNRPRNYLSAAPTFIPQNLVDQIQFVDDGADKWIYVYINKVWVGIKDGSGGSGSPAGSNTQLQYNNGGSFGGITGATSNGTEVTLNQPTINSFASCQHDHSNGSQGGQLAASTCFGSGTVPVARLPVMVGDSGSGGTAGLVPAPAAGDSGKFLKGDGSFGTPGTSGFTSRLRAYLSADQNHGLTGYEKINFNTEVFDGDSEYDNATNYRFTAGATGYYLVNVKVTTNRLDNTIDDVISLFKNGSAIDPAAYFIQRSSTGAYNPFALLTTIVSLSASDYIDVRVNLGSYSGPKILGGAGLTFLEVHRLS